MPGCCTRSRCNGLPWMISLPRTTRWKPVTLLGRCSLTWAAMWPKPGDTSRSGSTQHPNAYDSRGMVMIDIRQIAAGLTLLANEQAEWPPSRLRVRTYLTATLPPLDLVTSVRALVRQHDQVLVVRDPLSVHIL